MIESALHVELIIELEEYVNSIIEPGSCPVLVDLLGRPPQGKPFLLNGFIPDLFVPSPFYIIGEAKTANDLESERSLQQLESYIRYLANHRTGRLVVAVPLPLINRAKRVVRLLCEQSGCPEPQTDVIFIGVTNLSYGVNTAGYITGITDNLTSGYNQSFSYGGKATNMLTLATTGSSLWGRASYSDTNSQNLLTANFPGRNLTYGYSRTFQLQTINQAGTGVSNITHDAVGNETAVGSSTYTYSARELLQSGDGITYTYDGAGRRVVAQNSLGTRASLYDPNMHLQAESGLTSGTLAYEYVWFGGTPVAQIGTGGSTHWTVTDQRGAPYMQTTSTGSLYWQADYEPFGAVYDERTSDVHQPLRLPGQEAEEFSTSEGPNGASGRYYNGFRWYRPQLGRYTQPDPLQFVGSTYNLYAYSGNNPVNYLDPLGLNCSKWSGPPSWFAPVLAGIAFGLLVIATDGIAADMFFAAEEAGEAAELVESLDVLSTVEAADADAAIPLEAQALASVEPAEVAAVETGGVSVEQDAALSGGIVSATDSAGSAAADAGGGAPGGGSGAFEYYMQQAQAADVSTAENGAVFYSGPGNQALAEEFAVENGKTTIEMTPGGNWLQGEDLFGDGSPLSVGQAQEVWSVLSGRFAAGASGTAVGFVEGAPAGGIFTTVEYPALQANPNILNVLTGGF